MRRLKWAALTFVLGLVIIMDPSHSPAQFGKKGGGGDGGGGFGKRGGDGGGFGKKGGGGGGFGAGGFAPAAPGGAPGGAPAIYITPDSGSTGGAPGGFGGMNFGGKGGPGGGGMNFGGKGGPGGGGMNFGGKGGGGGGGKMDPEQIWTTLAGNKDTLDLSQINPQIRDFGRRMAERTGAEPLPESGMMSKADFLAFSARNAAKISAVMSNGPGGGPGRMGGPDMRMMDFRGPPGGYDGMDMGDYANGGGNRRNEKKDTEEEKPVAMRYGHLPKDLPDWFESCDFDKDGQVALWEWRKAGRNIAEFQEMDLNGDGLITADELLRFNLLQGGDASMGMSATPRGGRGNQGLTVGVALPGSTPPSSDRSNVTREKGGERGGKGSRPPQGGTDNGSEKTTITIDSSDDSGNTEKTDKTDKSDKSEKTDKNDKGSGKPNPFREGGKKGRTR